MRITTKNIRGRGTPLREYEIYVGRANARHGLARSPLANPFALKNEADRLAVIARYGDWLSEQIAARNSAVLGELARIRALAAVNPEVELYCWCAPRACHADIIAHFVGAPSAAVPRTNP